MLDASALAAWSEARISLQAWVTVARNRGLTLLLPELARTEVLTLRPEATEILDALAAHPHVLHVSLADPDRETIEAHLSSANAFDVLAAWVIRLCRQRGWAALSADPGRLHRLAPDLDIDQL